MAGPLTRKGPHRGNGQKNQGGKTGGQLEGQAVCFLLSETHVAPRVPREHPIRKGATVMPGPTRPCSGWNAAVDVGRRPILVFCIHGPERQQEGHWAVTAQGPALTPA